MGRHGGKLEYLYKCSCVIDRLAEKLSYDDYVEAATFARYSTLPGKAAAFSGTRIGQRAGEAVPDARGGCL